MTDKRSTHYIVQADKVMPSGLIKCLRPHYFRHYQEAEWFVRYYAAVMLQDDTIKAVNTNMVTSGNDYIPLFAIYNPKYYNTL